MGNVVTTGGAKFFVGTKTYLTGSNPTLALTDFTTGETYVEAKQLNDLGEFGDKAQSVSFETISDNRVIKVKGIRDAGDCAITFGRDTTDAGQNALRAAVKDDFVRSFKVVLTDKITTSGTPTTYYFRALTMDGTTKFAGANEIIKQVFTLGINSEILEVAAT